MSKEKKWRIIQKDVVSELKADYMKYFTPRSSHEGDHYLSILTEPLGTENLKKMFMSDEFLQIPYQIYIQIYL